VYGEALKERFEGVRPTSTSDSSSVRGNEKFIAFPYDATGKGFLYILNANKTGKPINDKNLRKSFNHPALVEGSFFAFGGL
jgi:hypothetical protein